MQYWIAGGIGAAVVVALGLLLSRLDKSGHAAPPKKEQMENKEK